MRFAYWQLVSVNWKTFERTPKPSAYFFRDVIRKHGIDHELRKKWLEGLSDLKTYELPIKKGS